MEEEFKENSEGEIDEEEDEMDEEESNEDDELEDEEENDDFDLIEVSMRDKDIDEVIAKLAELKENKKNVQFPIASDLDLLVHYDSDIGDEEDE